jgi:hypothetical protein
MRNSLTEDAAERQIAAMGCARYRIGIYDRGAKTMDSRDGLEPGGVMGLVRYLKFKNLNGCDIYVTQATGIDRALILVDDLDGAKIGRMTEEGIEPACVTETSPGNMQAWVSLGEATMARPLRTAAASLLARRFGGDPASADANHLGRLAGFSNRKPKHLAGGLYPFVLLRSAAGRSAASGSMIREMAAREAAAAGERIKNAAAERPAGRGTDPGGAFASLFGGWRRRASARGVAPDISAGDFAAACGMMAKGYTNGEIYVAMLAMSPGLAERKRNHVDDYINRTIKAANKRVSQES